MFTFAFSAAYTKNFKNFFFINFGSVKYNVGFAFRGGSRDKICVLNNTPYRIKNHNQANSNSYSLQSVEQAMSYFLGNCFFKVAFQIIFRYLDLYCDPDLFFANLLLFHQESESIGKTKNIDHPCGIRTINTSLLVIVENIQY